MRFRHTRGRSVRSKAGGAMYCAIRHRQGDKAGQTCLRKLDSDRRNASNASASCKLVDEGWWWWWIKHRTQACGIWILQVGFGVRSRVTQPLALGGSQWGDKGGPRIPADCSCSRGSGWPDTGGPSLSLGRAGQWPAARIEGLPWHLSATMQSWPD